MSGRLTYFAGAGWHVGVNLDPDKCRKCARKSDGEFRYFFETSDGRVVTQSFLQPTKGGAFGLRTFAEKFNVLPARDVSFPDFAHITRNWREYLAWLELRKMGERRRENGLV